MGMTVVELFIAIEDRFQLIIADEEANAVVTVMHLRNLIARKLLPPQDDVCLSSNTFYRTRTALMTLFNTERRSVQLDAPLATFIPWWQRRRHWSRLTQMLSLTMPQLEAPGWLQTARVLLFFGVAAAVWLFFTWIADDSAFAGIVFGMLAGVLALAFAVWLTEPFEIAIPRHCHTIRQFVTHLVRLNYGEATAGVPRSVEDAWSDEKIWQAMVEEIMHVCNVKPEAVTPYTRLENLCG